MAWVRMDDRMLDHPKFVGLFNPKDPIHCFLWGLSYSQTYRLDGFLSHEAVRSKCQASAVEKLVARRLWDVIEGGYQIHGYLDWNDSREVIDAKIHGARDRKEKYKKEQERNRDGTTTERILGTSPRSTSERTTQPNPTQEVLRTFGEQRSARTCVRK
jgi:hypothetical protein